MSVRWGLKEGRTLDRDMSVGEHHPKLTIPVIVAVAVPIRVVSVKSGK